MNSHASARQDHRFWRDFPEAVQAASRAEDVRAIVLMGAGKAFTAGLDVTDPALSGNLGDESDGEQDVARRAIRLQRQIRWMQHAISSVAEAPVPVIAAVHGACVGAGVDLITACDVRMAAEGSYFSVREVKIGLAADVGTLQRLPKVAANDSLVRELCFTGEDFPTNNRARHTRPSATT